MRTRLYIGLLLLPCLVAFSSAGEFQKRPKLSSFAAQNIARDPFERIDAKYLAEQASVVNSANSSSTDLAQHFRVTAISIARLGIAIINGKAFAEQEKFTVRASNKEIKAKLLKVSEAGVELDCEGTRVTVPIVRERPKLTDDLLDSRQHQ